MLRWQVLRVALFAPLTVVTASAQSATSGASVSGTVFDSVARVPLRGAVVQVVKVDSAGSTVASTSNFAAIADADGHYRISGLPRGTYGIGFQHSALTALRLESPLRGFRVASDTGLTIDLAIPKGAVVRGALCRNVSDVDGVLAGVALRGSQGTALAGATVVLGWVEVAVVEGRFRTVPRRVTAVAEEDGSFVACALASATPLTVAVSRSGYRDIIGEITVPAGDVLRRDFRLADTTSGAATGVITGRLLHADGGMVASGQVSVAALELDAPVLNGAFSLGGLPTGTWSVEARVIGYEPQLAFVDVVEGAPATLQMTVGPKVQVLDAINIVGKPSHDLKVLNEVAARRRTAAGSVFLPGNVWLESADTPVDVLRAARGFILGGPRGCGEQGSKLKHLAVYLDGLPFEAGLQEIGNLVPMRDILAIEAYPDAHSVPAIWRATNVCALVAVWTKH